MIDRQEKIGHFDDKLDNVKPRNEAKIFNTACKLGRMIFYDRIFSKIGNTRVEKEAQVLFSPCGIVRGGMSLGKDMISLEQRRIGLKSQQPMLRIDDLEGTSSS